MTELYGGDFPRRTIKDILAETEAIRTVEYQDPRFAGLVDGQLEDAYLIADAIQRGAIDSSKGAVLWAIKGARAEKDGVIDEMTGLYTKGRFEAKLETELVRAKRTGTPTAIAYIDLDDFSLVNNQESHEQGHAVLGEVGHVLRSSIREYDLAGRCGGEEIVLALANTTETQATDRLEVIRQELPERVIAGLQSRGVQFDRRITASVGVAEIAFDDPRSEEPTSIAMRKLLDRADQRMRMAKVAGKNRVVGSHEEEAFRHDPQFMRIGRTGKYRIR